MGAADVVPGVSGGTIAFITGIYTEFIRSLSRCGPEALKILFTQGFAAAWRHVNANFLIVLFAGILLSIKLLAGLLLLAIEQHPILVWSFFSGLILASILLLYKSVPKWRWNEMLGFILGAFFVAALSYGGTTQVPANGIVIFLCGFIAICAMILPGISGSFILLLLGAYTVVLKAVDDINIVLLLSFLGGCICGLIVFSRVLTWLLESYKSITMSVLIGFLLGSLYVTWPWKTVVEWAGKGDEKIALVTENLLPYQFELLTGNDAQWLWAAIMAIFGAVLILLVEFFGKKDDTKS